MHFAIGDQLRRLDGDRHATSSSRSTSSSGCPRTLALDGDHAQVPSAHPQGHAVPARAAAGPRLLPVAQAPRGDLRRTGAPDRGVRGAGARGRRSLRPPLRGERPFGDGWNGRGPGSSRGLAGPRRIARRSIASAACCSESTSAGRSPTPSLFDGARPPHGEGADDPGRPVAGGDRGGRGGARARRGDAARGRALRPRDDRRHQRAARGARRAHGAGRHRGLHRPARDRPPEPARASTGSARRSRRRWSRAELRFEAARADRRRRASSSRSADARARARWPSAVARRRRRVGRGLPAVLLPRPRARARDRRAPARASCPASTSPPRTRCCRASASTSAARRR